MSEKWYVVSESELQKLYECAYNDGHWNCSMEIDEANPEYSESTNIAEGACRARPADNLLAVVEAAKQYYRNPGSPIAGSILHDALAELEGKG